EGTRRDAHGRHSRSRARPRRRLCHHHHRRRLAASRSPAQAAQRFRPGRARPPDRRRDGAGGAGRSRAEIPPLVSRATSRGLQIGRRADRAGHALRRAEDRSGQFHARRRRTAGARQHRSPHPADFLHRLAGGRRPSATRADAGRGADHRSPLARGYRAARCLCAGADGCGIRAAAEGIGTVMDIDLPDVLAEVTAQFQRYENALVSNDVAVLDELFHRDARTLRYSIAENLYGYGEIASFRAARSPVGLMRRTARTIITSYGRDTAVATTLFYRDTLPGKVGRQMQTWVRFADGWRIVAAHVSVIDEPKGMA